MSSHPFAHSDPATAPPPTEAAAASWEDDETWSTLGLRSLVTLAAGALLLLCQLRAPISPGSEWSRWVGAALLLNFLLPLGMVWMVFGQGLSRPSWLQNQRLNAWSYGWDFRDWKRHVKIALILFVAMLPLLWLFSRMPEARSYYAGYFPAITSTPALLVFVLTSIIYMLCWEWFFRGFLLFGLAQGFGWIPAVILQAALFGFAHSGKPGPEMLSSFAGGAILGVLCWREKSFAPAFYTHALIHLAWSLFVFYG